MGDVQNMLAVSREAEAQKIKDAGIAQAKADAERSNAGLEAFKKFEDAGGGTERGLNPDEKAEAKSDAEVVQPVAEEALETGEPDSDEVDEKPETESNDEDTDTGEESRRVAAMNLLKRSKVPESVLKATDIDTLEAWASDAKTLNAAQEETYRQLTELRKAKPDGEQDSKESGDVIAAPDQPDGATLKAARATLVEEFGEDAAKAMEALMAPQQAENRALREVVTSMQDRDLNQEVSGQRARLEGAGYEFTTETWDAVEAKAAALTRTGEYEGNFKGLFDDAAKLLLDVPEKKTTPDTKQRERGAATRGKSSSKDAPKTPRQKQWAMMRAREREDPNWQNAS